MQKAMAGILLVLLAVGTALAVNDARQPTVARPGQVPTTELKHDQSTAKPVLRTGVVLDDGTYGLPSSNLYYKVYANTYLMQSDKAGQNISQYRSASWYDNYQSGAGMDPAGEWIVEQPAYNYYIRKFAAVSGSYVDYYTGQYPYGYAVGCDANYIYKHIGYYIYKWNLSDGSYINSTYISRYYSSYHFGVANDTLWDGDGSSYFYAYPTSAMTGGSISYTRSQYIGYSSGATWMNITWDGTYYFITSGGYSSNGMRRFPQNWGSYTDYTVALDMRSVLAVGIQLDYDVGSTAITSPPPVCDIGSYYPQVIVKNFGIQNQPSDFYVKFTGTGPTSYLDSVLCPALTAGEEETLTFTTPWALTTKGAYTAACSTMSVADSSRGNDKLTMTVKAGMMRVLFVTADYPSDVQATADSLMNKYPNDFLIDVMDVGYYYTEYAPNVDTLLARGYKAVWTWGNYSYMDGAACGDSLARYMERGGGGCLASNWTFGAMGRFDLYTPTANPLNSNYESSTLGTVYEPTHRIMEGVSSLSYNYYTCSNNALSHTTAYKVADWATNNILAACNDSNDCKVAVVGFFPTGATWGYAGGDVWLLMRNAIMWAAMSNDVGVSRLIAPTGDIDSGAVITPACSVYNYGPTAEGPFKVRLRIGGYEDSVTVATLASREAAYVTFSDWTATLRGTFAVSCSTEYAIDSKRGNDKKAGSGYIHVRDVQALTHSTPKGNYASGAVVVPSGTWKNNGNGAASFEAWMVLYRPNGVRHYASKTNVPGLVPGGTMQIGSFAPCTLRIAGTWTVRCSSYLATGDMVSGNDFFDSTFTVTGGTQEGGWLAKSAMPLAPGGKDMKDGAWLAHNAGDGLVYAAKGNKQGDFYSYDPVADAWTQRLSWPAGREAKGPYKGAAAVSDGAGKVYATKGNNTQGFWLYDAVLNTWTQKANVPLGPTNKKVKGGTDLAYYDGLVYLLKGYKDEFWRYNPASDSWYQLPNAPTGINGKWNVGSWMTGDGAGKLYAHKSKYHEFYAFDIAASAWGPALIPMPLASYTGKSRKSKDGGAGAYADGAIYAFKGGNTQEFWKYDVAGNAWTEKETIPQVVPSSSKKKKVKGGADIVAVGPVFFATKGNKAPNIWQYTPGMFSYEPRVGREGIAAGTTVPGTTLLSVSPNPMAGGFVTVSFNLPRTTSATLSVRDLTGRTVASQLVSGRSGTVGLDLRHLSTGVYMVELISGGVTATQKLVVQH